MASYGGTGGTAQDGTSGQLFKTLISSDALLGQIGFVDVANPSRPTPGGTLVVDGSPTSVATVDRYALVAVDTTEGLTAPSGHLAVVDVAGAGRMIVTTLPVAGQPDAIVTDNDAVDDAPGETQLLRLGDARRLFR
jgi:hypothetical protein